jgi:hypothetical protein
VGPRTLKINKNGILKIVNNCKRRQKKEKVNEKYRKQKVKWQT